MALNPDDNRKHIGPLTKAYTWKDAVTYALAWEPGSPSCSTATRKT